jgi:hypothetical protein
MKFLLVIPLAASLLLVVSCETGGKAATAKLPATPPVPSATAAKPPTPPPPLSTPQTDVQLPPAQAPTPEALATIQVVEELPSPAQPPAAKPAARRPPATNAPPPKPETPASTPAPAETPPAPPPNPPAAEEPPRLQRLYTEDEKRRVMADLERRKAEIDVLLKGISPGRLSADQKSVLDGIHSLLNSAESTAQHGDYSSADKLSARALFLAKELASGR